MIKIFVNLKIELNRKMELMNFLIVTGTKLKLT